MEPLLLLDMEASIQNAYFLNAHDSESIAQQTLEDYSEELAYDLDQIPQGMRTNYEKDYRDLFLKWLFAQSYCEDPFVTEDYSRSVKEIKKARQAADKRYWEFREWRENTLAAARVSPRPSTKWPWG